jgi:hypothetical protein
MPPFALKEKKKWLYLRNSVAQAFSVLHVSTHAAMIVGCACAFFGFY